jgi:hypothetical protein
MSEVSELLLDAEDFTLSNYGLNRSLKRSLYGQLTRVRDVERFQLDGSSDRLNSVHLETLSPLIYWSITLLLKRHLFTYAPAEILYPAEVIVDLLQRPSPSSPFDIHSLALATITLLEITDIPDLANDAWESLEKVLQLLGHREKQTTEAREFTNLFPTPGWDAAIRSFIETKLAKSRSGQQQPNSNSTAANASTAPPVVGPSEQRSLQHLADLAVGAGGGPGNASSPPATATGNAAPDEKDSTLATGPVPMSPKPHHRVVIDFTRLTKKGYLNVFAGL